MVAPQLSRVVQRPSTFPRRKALVVAATVLVAGGGLAYFRTSQRRPHRDSSVAQNGNGTEKLSELDGEKGKELIAKKKPKRGGIKNVKVLAGLLLQHIGKGGLNEFIALATISVLKTALSNRLAKVQGLLFRAAFLTRAPLFMQLITENLILCFLQSVFFSTTRFLTGALSLRFRKILTNRIHSDYFQNMTYYKMSHTDHRISSVEQRIASDVPRFSTEMSELVQENLAAIFDGILYTWRLCSYASPKYAFGVLGYVIGAGVTIQALSPPFGKLMSTEQQLEGEYRQLHSRLRTHSESIAFYGGQDREASIITQRFRTLVKHLGKVLHTQWWFGMIQDFVLKYLGSTFGLVLIIEPFFSGSLRPDGSTLGRAQMLSLMRYHTSVIISLFQAMGTLASNTRKLGRLSGYADRISELMSVSRELRIAGSNESIQKKESGSHFVEAPYIEFEGVKVVTPTGTTLVENLTLKVEPGSNLLITGPNGSGKSSLFRVLGGLWPLVEGRIAKPGMGSALSHEIFYVPQRPYTSVGTLRDQLIYPLTSAEETQPLTTEGMRELLRNVDLEYLLDRYPQSQEVIWGDELSLGEQQRLGMARLFYHRPSFAILDECTSAVTTDMEERFCEKVRAMGTSCVTISHRPALVAFHDTVLSLDGEGGWTVHYKTDTVSQPHSELQQNGDLENGDAHTDRQSDALTVKKQFFANIGQVGNGEDTTAVDSYVGAVLATSPPRDPLEVVPAVHGLQIKPKSMPVRISSLFKILVPTLSDEQGGQLLAVALLVLGRTCLSDRIADLNGTSVKHVLRQDKAAFIRLVGVSVLQSGVSSFLAPSLRWIAQCLQETYSLHQAHILILVAFHMVIRSFIEQKRQTITAYLSCTSCFMHMTATLALGWRHRLTKHLSALYFQNYGFYKAVHLTKSGTNDADQRITQDVEKLSGDLSGLVTGMVKPFVDIVWFTYRMKVLTGIRGVGFLYAYMLLGLGFLRAITPNFGALTSKEQQLEGSFRYIHSRLRTHAESVAFFGGGSREQAVTAGRFKALLAHSQNLLRMRWIFGIADDFITKQLPHNVTWGLSLMYAMEHKGNRALTSVQGELAHDLRFLASVVSQSFLAFGDILELYRKFLELSGGITRVSELNELLIAAQNGKRAAQSKANPLLSIEQGRSSLNGDHTEVNEDVVFEDVDIVTPGQKLLARKLTMRVPAGKSLLVTGPNGSGKSSLFRVLGGLWPAGSGHIAKPGQFLVGNDSRASQTNNTGLSRDIFYVPQRPYTALGTLRDQIIYPLTLADAELKAQLESQQGSLESPSKSLSVPSLGLLDRRLRTILEDVRLVYLLDREGGWDASANWEDMLSLGEQQRLGMARLFFHHPKFGILDECTNATSVDVEESLYKKAQALGISVVTISQRPALIPYHAMELRLIDGEGAWELRSIQASSSD